MPSLGMFSARAAIIAARSRAFIAGSGRPSLAAVVISRASLENSLERALSWRPLRCMMFLNWECPAIVVRHARSNADTKARGGDQPRESAKARLQIDENVRGVIPGRARQRVYA